MYIDLTAADLSLGFGFSLNFLTISQNIDKLFKFFNSSVPGPSADFELTRICGHSGVEILNPIRIASLN